MGVLVDLNVDVKPHLRIDPASASNDASLNGFIDAAEIVIQDITGPIVGTSYTEDYDGGNEWIVTRHRPILSIQNVVENQGPVQWTLQVVSDPHLCGPYSVTFEPYGRIVRRLTGGFPTPFYPGPDTVRISYTAGQASTPANVRLATLELIRHLWQMAEQSGRPALGAYGAEEDVIAPHSGFAVPTRVIELLEPHKRPPSIA